MSLTQSGWSIISSSSFFFFNVDVDHFKAFIEFATTLLLFYVLVFWPQGMWDVSFPTKNQTHSPLHWKAKS